MLSVVVPYTVRRPEVLEPLAATGRSVETVDVSGSDDAYWNLLAALWVAGDGWLNVEHDVVVSGAVLDELERCPSDWCAAPFPYDGRGTIVGLGCVKFASPLLARVPDAAEVVGYLSDAGHRPKHWCRLDAWLRRVLADSGEVRCFAHSPVGHLGGRPAHGCRP